MRRIGLLGALLCACVDTTVPDAGGARVDAASADARPGADDARPGNDDAAGDEDARVDAAGPDAAPAGEDARADATIAEDADAGMTAPDAATPPRAYDVYIGCGDGNIHHYALDPATAELTRRGATPAGNNPSFLAWSATTLYAVDEVTRGGVNAFTIDAATGALTAVGARVSSEGNGPAHLSLAASGRAVLVSNYGDGRIAVLPIGANGALSAASDSLFAGNNAHQILTDASSTKVLVPCLGANYVAQYLLDAAGDLTANATPNAPLPRGAGPRHVVLHPSERWAYVMNELDSTVTAFDYDVATGRLANARTQTALPAGFLGNNSGAEIAAHPNGRFVYSSNRGHDSIARFAVDGATGDLTLIGHTPTGGSTPRHFSLTSDGLFMLVANQQSNDVRVFRVDAGTGALTAAGTPITVSRPAFAGAR